MEHEHNHHNNVLENENFESIITAFKLYRNFSMERVNKTERYLNTLPSTHQDMLRRYREHLYRIRDCIEQNSKVIKHLLRNVDSLFSPDDSHTIPSNENHDTVQIEQSKSVEVFKLLKVQITLKQFARDWSDVGAEERRQCYNPIIDEITAFYNPNKMNPGKIRILVPGAGLGRLTYELACRGYYCQGNEFSYCMLLASNFVLNHCVIDNQYTIYPWVHQYVNNKLRSDQIASITFPDVSPIFSPPIGEMSMVAGDFLEVYRVANDWDCVATCFFIDCAKNVVQFVENIYNILKPGAIWVNLGPLLYHYSDAVSDDSIEPSYEDLVSVIGKIGFEFLKNETGVRTKYSQNPNSMQINEYLSVFFVCRKPLLKNTSTNGEDDE